MRARTVQELIDLLQAIEDKEQEIFVWNDNGFYGTNLKVGEPFNTNEEILIIEPID